MMRALPAMIDLQASGGPDYSFFVMMGAIFLIFYFLVIRPQSQRQKQHEEALKKAEKGDQVVTSGGIHGRILAVADDAFTVEIAKGVKVKVERARIDRLTKDDGSSTGKGDES